ncbi:MAG: VanW family protein [Thermoleophilia bacterium]|nr:VanW family protein [Thermoleophilia bacterium]
MSGKGYTVYRPPGRRRRRVWRVGALVLVLTLAGLTGSGAWLARAESGRLPPDVRIGGIEVGGLPPDEARQLLEREAAEIAARPVELTYEGGTLRITGTQLGLEPSIDEALAVAQGSRGSLSRLKARLGLADPVEIPLTFATRPERVAKVLARVEAEVERRPVSAKVTLAGDAVLVTPAQPGIALDTEAAAAALAGLPEGTIALELAETEPKITTEEALAVKASVETLVADPPQVYFKSTRWRPSPPLVRGALELRNRRGAIEVALDPELIERPLRRAFREHEREPLDATFRVKGKRVVVVPGREGRAVSAAAVATALLAAAGQPKVKVVFEALEPELTTEKAEAMRITELVSEFSTPYPCCAPRVTNIQLAASILDGHVIPPDGRFSLNEALGERTAERGFVMAPMIQAGKLVDSVGGGVSQVATTFYNAAFFAGLDLVAHTPHEFYISRYPMGREATVSWGGPELVFKNDWPAGVLVKVVATDTSITVRFYSSKLGRRVETATGDPYNYTSASTVRVYNPSLPPGTESTVQSGGISGFTVDYWRKVYRGKKLLRDEEWTVRYLPENSIVEYGPKQSKDKDKDKDGDTDTGTDGGDGGDVGEDTPDG